MFSSGDVGLHDSYCMNLVGFFSLLCMPIYNFHFSYQDLVIGSWTILSLCMPIYNLHFSYQDLLIERWTKLSLCTDLDTNTSDNGNTNKFIVILIGCVLFQFMSTINWWYQFPVLVHYNYRIYAYQYFKTNIVQMSSSFRTEIVL